jgi:hypothetical protein
LKGAFDAENQGRHVIDWHFWMENLSEAKVRVILVGFRRNDEAYLNAAKRLGLL